MPETAFPQNLHAQLEGYIKAFETALADCRSFTATTLMPDLMHPFFTVFTASGDTLSKDRAICFLLVERTGGPGLSGDIEIDFLTPDTATASYMLTEPQQGKTIWIHTFWSRENSRWRVRYYEIRLADYMHIESA